MNKPVQWMTLQELRDELELTRPAWEATDLDGFLADGQLPPLSQVAHRHQGSPRSCCGDRATAEPAGLLLINSCRAGSSILVMLAMTGRDYLPFIIIKGETS
jgi:hypothetical protein